MQSGPGYSVKAAPGAPMTAAAGRLRDAGVTNAALERRREPIVCQGARLLHIDNRNLAFDGDAVSAEDGCEIYITNTHISATGVGRAGAQRQRAHRQQPDRGRRRLDRCFRGRAGVCRFLALPGLEPAPGLGHLPRPGGQHLELIPPAGISHRALRPSGARLRGAARPPGHGCGPAGRLGGGARHPCRACSPPATSWRSPARATRSCLPRLIASGDLERAAGARLSSPRAPRRCSRPRRRRESECMALLRRWRRYEYARIAWRDLAGWADARRDARRAHAAARCGDRGGARAGARGAGGALRGAALGRHGEAQPLHRHRHGQARRRRAQLLLRHRPGAAVPGARRHRRRARDRERGILHAPRRRR